jgi:hypothetical protein
LFWFFHQIFTFVNQPLIWQIKSLGVDNDNNNRQRQESEYSNKVRAGKRRTYFFDVRRTKGDDFYLTLTESTKRFNNDGYERHKIFLYKEDFNRFIAGLEDAINYVKTELMPEYDYDEFTRRHEEFEAQRDAEENYGAAPVEPAELENEEDMTW